MEPHKTLMVKGGSRLYLRCAVTANPQPEWTWIKDGKVIQSDGNVFEKKTVNANDAGRYTCVAKNLKGQKSVAQDIVVLGKLRRAFEGFGGDGRCYSSMFIHSQCKNRYFDCRIGKGVERWNGRLELLI